MELERRRCDFERRIDEGRREIRERIEKVEQRCKKAEEARKQEWEDLKGRVMTAQEEQRHHGDGMLRLMSAMTDEYVTIIRAMGDDMRQGFAELREKDEEGRAQLRANTEAVLRMLDRLPPGLG
jgi:hypothetical protein